MGVIFFVVNAAFALVLLILVLVSSVYALISKNPDIRYQPMRDDRGSFIKSNSQMFPSTELDALGATARGDMKARDLEDDADSFSTTSQQQQQHLQLQLQPHDASEVPLPPSTAGSNRAGPTSGFDMPHSPVGTSVPLFPTNSHDSSRQPPYAGQQHAGGMALLTPGGTRSRTASPTPSQRTYGSQGLPSPQRHDGGGGGGYPQQQQQSGPQGNWQVGVGYSN